MTALYREAEATDRPGSSTTWANTTAEERPGIVADALIWRRGNLPNVRTRLGAHYLGELAAGDPEPLIFDRLDPAGHTILHGTGGAGKGTLATFWIANLVGLGHRVVILDYENHPDEWARRYRGFCGTDPEANVMHVSPLAASWQGERGALWRQEQDVRELCEAYGATYVVIDSIVPACGGADPVDPGTVARYAGALEYIGRPALSLGHVPKSGGLEYPFGSAFWHNLARCTWSLSRDGERLLLVNHKANNYARRGRFSLSITWWEGLPRDIAEQGYTAALSERIDEVLGERTMTVAQLVGVLADAVDDDESAPPADSVRKTLRRGLQADPPRYTVDGTGHGAKWSRVPA